MIYCLFRIFLCVMVGCFWQYAYCATDSAGISSASSGPVPAIAMRGTPKHLKNFIHFSVYNPDAPKGGHVRFAEIKNVFDTVNPFAFGANPAQGLGRYHYLTFDTLMEKAPDEPFSLYGRLAETVELATDRSWITFHLNPGARFHDGTPVMAKDVKVTFDVLAQQAGPAYKIFHTKIKSIDILGPRSVRIVFNRLPNGEYDQEAPFTVAMRVVLSAQDLEGRVFSREPLKPLLGSGPYKIESIDFGRSITYVRSADYWGRDLPSLRGLYNFERITYEYFASDVVAFEAFKAGLIDHWVETSPQRWVASYDFPAVTRGDIKQTPVFFNDAALVTFLIFNLKKEPLDHRLVRIGLGGLFDFQWIKTHLYQNAYNRNDSHFAEMAFAARGPVTQDEVDVLKTLPEVPAYAFDAMPEVPLTKGDGDVRVLLERSQGLFREAGWAYKDGALRNASGVSMTLTLVITDKRFEKLALMYSRVLKRAGITLIIKLVDSAHYQKILSERSYDLMITTYGTGLSPGVEQQLYYGSYFAHVPSRNHAGVDSKAVDALCDMMIKSTTYEAQVFYCKLLDRLLRTAYYMVPLNYKSSSDVAFWKCLGHPPLKTHFVPSIYSWWWIPGCQPNR